VRVGMLDTPRLKMRPRRLHELFWSRAPGRSVRREASRQYERAGLRALFAGLLAVLGIMLAAAGSPAVGVLIGLVVLRLGASARAACGVGRRFDRGAQAEERVGAVLDSGPDSWRVEHDVLKARGGNVDHVVKIAETTFIIDTKATRWRTSDLAQARRHQEWAREVYGFRASLVQVICVGSSGAPAREVDGIFIVGAGQLIPFLSSWS